MQTQALHFCKNANSALHFWKNAGPTLHFSKNADCIFGKMQTRKSGPLRRTSDRPE
jgi:hypothetical protein